MNAHTFAAKVKSIMLDNSFDRSVSGFRSGKLDKRSLHKIMQTDRLFKKKIQRNGKKYNVSLVVDCSGSMRRDGKLEAAAEAAQLLAEGLEKSGVDFEIVAFNTFVDVLKPYGVKMKNAKNVRRAVYEKVARPEADKLGTFRYCRSCGALWPQFDEQYESNHSNGCSARDTRTDTATQGNCDGEALHDVKQHILEREGGKIIVMLSDGNPHFDIGMDYTSYQNPKMKYSDYSLGKEVNDAIAKGIVFVGIGILTEAVYRYYPETNCAVVHNPKLIYQAVVGRLSNLIKRG